MWHWIKENQVLAVSIAAGAAYIAWELRYVVAILLAGYILAAALRPAVDWLGRTHVPRVLSVLLVYLALIGGTIGIFFLVIEPIVGQAGQLTTHLSSTLSQLVDPATLAQYGFTLDQLRFTLGTNVIPVTTTALAGIAAVVTAIIISMYLTYDWHERHARLSESGRTRWRTLAAVIDDADRSLGSWVRGQLLLSAIVGALVFIAMFALGIPYAPVLGVLAAFFELIPYAGPILAALPAVLLALSQSATEALIVAAIYLVIQQFENHILVPLVMKRSVDLHPVTVIASLLIGFEVIGIVGALLAVPVATLLRVGAAHAFHD